MAIRAIPDCFYDFIRQEERRVARVYDDARPDVILKPGDQILGRLTAGYGHTGDDVAIGMAVSDDQIDEWLVSDAETAAKRLSAQITDAIVDLLTIHQYAALLSFVFSVGANPAWAIWGILKAKKFDQVPTQLSRFVNATIGGKTVKVQGLVNRRAAEVVLWSTDEPGSVPDAPPSSVTRAAQTPPTPPPPSKSKGLIVGAVGAVAGAGPIINQATQAIQPYAEHSHYVQASLSILATVAAVCAAVGLFYMWLQKREAKN